MQGSRFCASALAHYPYEPGDRVTEEVAAAADEPGAAGSAASTCGWSDTDALGGQELAGAAQLTVACEGVPRLVEVLLVYEIAEPAECARAFDRPLQPLP